MACGKCLVRYYASIDQDITTLDCSQSPGRCFVGNNNVVSTIVPNSRVWYYAKRRPILGLECLLIHGFSPSFFDPTILEQAAVTDELMKDLAGNSKAGHCFAALLLAIIARWPTQAMVKHNEARDAKGAQDSEAIDTDAVGDILGI